jgi:hypothetical protein
MIPSAAPYSVTWNAERQVTTGSPLIERAFLCLPFSSALPVKSAIAALCLPTALTLNNIEAMLSTARLFTPPPTGNPPATQ